MLAVQITRQHIVQACVKLIILNVKSPHTRPWVLLTDLNNRFKFLWMDGATIYTSAEDASTGWGIFVDLLHCDLNILFSPSERNILARQAIPAELRRPRGRD